MRYDYVATIKTETGHKKVLIEIQKANNPVDLMRFRDYLAEQYKKEDEIDTPNGKQKTPLPIITIYLLAFTLQDIEAAAVRVNREYTNLLTLEIIHAESEFIEKLTHDSYVMQMPRIQTRHQTRLEKLLGIFEQNYFVDDNGIIKEYNQAIDDETIRSMV